MFINSKFAQIMHIDLKGVHFAGAFENALVEVRCTDVREDCEEINAHAAIVPSRYCARILPMSKILTQFRLRVQG